MKLFLKNHPWLIFILGILLGITLLFVYNHFQSPDPNITSQPKQEAVYFDIRDNDHILGNKDSNITLVVFQDFTCPYCRVYIDTLENLIDDYGNSLRIVWRHFPLNFNNPAAIAAAEAAECATEQGQFWSYAKSIFDNQEELNTNYSNDFFLKIAKDLDVTALQECLENNSYRDKAQAHYNEGLIKGVVGTPANFLNGRYIPGALPYYDLQQLIDPLIQ